jgi:predicted O-methyltransferase YrrM
VLDYTGRVHSEVLICVYNSPPVADPIQFHQSIFQRPNSSPVSNFIRISPVMSSAGASGTVGVTTNPYEGIDPDIDVSESDPRWTAVDEYAVSHLHPSSKPYYAALEHALQNSRDKGLPDIAVSPLQGKYLAVQCQLLGSKHILEVGSLGAYSTIWLASASPDGKVVSIEIDEGRAAVARENIEFAGLGDRVEVIVAAALDVLPRLMTDIEHGKRDRFDFTFIDADKANALHYFDWAVKLSVPRACIYVDNMVRKGFLAYEELAKHDRNADGIRKALEGIGKDERVDASLLQTVSDKNYDGFVMAVVK